MATLIKIDKNGSKHWEGMVTCDRCQGRGWFATGVCNGELVPSRVDNAVCWKCGGRGKVVSKWIERTPEYQAKLDARRAKKIEAEMEKRKAEIEQQRKLEEERQRKEAERIRKEKEEQERIKAEKAKSQFIGQVGEKIDMKAKYDHTAWYDFKLGWSEERMYVHTFRDTDGNAIVWKTSSNSLPDLDDGDIVRLKGTVKKHEEYKDEKQTYLTRCKVEKMED